MTAQEINIKKLIIRPEMHKDYKDIVSLVLRSFREGTDLLGGYGYCCAD